MATTTYFGWAKPTVDGSDSTWGGTINDRLDDMDALMGGVTALSGTTPTIDLDTDVTTYTLTTTGNTTFTFSNPNASGGASYFSLILTSGGAHTITWPAAVAWPGGTTPPAPASGNTDVYSFVTTDGGTTYYGFQAGDDLN